MPSSRPIRWARSTEPQLVAHVPVLPEAVDAVEELSTTVCPVAQDDRADPQTVGVLPLRDRVHRPEPVAAHVYALGFLRPLDAVVGYVGGRRWGRRHPSSCSLRSDPLAVVALGPGARSRLWRRRPGSRPGWSVKSPDPVVSTEGASSIACLPAFGWLFAIRPAGSVAVLRRSDDRPGIRQADRECSYEEAAEQHLECFHAKALSAAPEAG